LEKLEQKEEDLVPAAGRAAGPLNVAGLKRTRSECSLDGSTEGRQLSAGKSVLK